MNCPLSIILRTAPHFRARIWLCFLTIAFSVSAQNQPSTTQTNGLSSDRVLVILDISAGMQKRSENLQRVVSQLFSSGFNGQVRRGDTIGMWTYNDTLHTGEFPLQRWSPQSARQITSVAAQFAQNQRYSKQSSLAPVMAQLTNIVADSDRITVVLVSDGSVSLAGTPFDSQIAEAFKLNASEQLRQAMPFVTVLRAVKGEFIGFKVNTPPWPTEYPAFPPEAIVAAPEPTNPPAAKVESPKPAPPSEPTAASVETNHPPTATTNPPALADSKPAPAEPVTNPLPTAAPGLPRPTSNVVKLPAPSTNIAKASAPATALPVSKPAGSSSIIPIVVGGTALVGLAMLCLALLRRARQPTRVSLITQSMNKNRK